MFRTGRGYFGAAALVFGLFTSLAPAAALELASYRAVYDIDLDAAASTGEVGEISGRVVTEFTGSSCAGYSASMRFVMAVENEDGGRQVTDTRTTSFEDPGGSALDFSNETYVDEKLASDSSGKARRTGKGITVSLTRPASKDLDLAASVIFPTQQVEHILSAAMAGRSFIEESIYDGTDGGQKTFATAAVIGREATGGEAEGPAADNLAGLRHWPITVSYFDGAEAGEQIATQVMSFNLYENGVQTNITINYGSFTIALRMMRLEMLPPVACP